MADRQLDPQQKPDADVDVKPADHAKQGPGVIALEHKLAAGTPSPKDVVKLIDAHRNEKQAMLALLQSRLGNAYVQQVVAAMDELRLSIANKELVSGDPSADTGGYFDLSAAQKGAKWKTANGAFAGKADQQGLDTTYKVDNDNSLHGVYDVKGKQGTLGYVHDGKVEGELFERQDQFNIPGDGAVKRTDLGLERPFSLDGGTADLGLRHEMRTDGSKASANDGLDLTYHQGALSGDAFVARNEGDGKILGGVGAKEKIDGNDYSARLDRGPLETSITAGFNNAQYTADAYVTENDAGGVMAGGALTDRKDKFNTISARFDRGLNATSGSVGYTHHFEPNVYATGSLAYNHPDHGLDQATMTMNGHYASSRAIVDGTAVVGGGARNYVDLKGNADAQLAPDMYGGAWGDLHDEQNQPATGHVGMGLTFTPNEKSALTLAGIVNEHGSLETRLQLDVFKSRVENVAELNANRKAALVSLFVSYQQHAGTELLDDRYGAPQLHGKSNDGQVVFGFKMTF